MARGIARVLTNEEKSEIAKRYANGDGFRILKKDYEIGETKIKNVLAEYGIVIRDRAAHIRQLSRDTHPCWKGGITKKISHGRWERFIKIPEDDPLFEMVDGGGYVREHRLIFSRYIGRPLTRSETVHHINGDTLDNRIENLQLRTAKNHGQGQAAQCGDCGSCNIIFVPLKGDDMQRPII